MDWKYKQIDREAIFQESPKTVAKAARRALAESLADWRFADTADGFEARGDAFAHSEIARFRFLPENSGTRVQVTLLVQRAGALGFMLFDIGDAYGGQIGKWLENIRRHLQPENAFAAPTDSAPYKMSARTKFFIGYIGCFGICILLFLLVQTVYAVIGIFTGSLYLLVGRESRDIVVHGIWARIIGAIILAFDAALIWAIFRWKKVSPKIPDPKN